MFSQKLMPSMLMKKIQKHPTRLIFSACYLRHDVFEERKKLFISKLSEDQLQTEKEHLQKVLSSKPAHAVDSRQITNLTYLCENENDVEILYPIITAFVEESRTKKYHETALKNYFSMCYARLDEKAAKKLANIGLSSQHCRNKYFSILYELRLFPDIIEIFENGLLNENSDDYCYYMASLCSIGNQTCFDKATKLMEKHFNYTEEKTLGGRTGHLYSFFATKQEEFGIAMDTLTQNQRKLSKNENRLTTNLKVYNYLCCKRSGDAYAYLENLNFHTDSPKISLSSENWNSFAKYQGKIKVLDKIEIIDDSVEEMVFKPIQLSDSMAMKTKLYEKQAIRNPV